MPDIQMSKTFVDALAKLDGADARRTAVFLDRLMEDTRRSSFNFEKVNDARDPKIRSARVSRELRVILYQDAGILLLLYVDHHDIAYGWARTKCVECHVVTGALQIVESPDRGYEQLASVESAKESTAAEAIFSVVADEYLLSIGVPPSWLPVIREIRSEAQFWSVAEDLPEAVAERLLRVMVGELVAPPVPVVAHSEPLDSPDTKHWMCTVSQDGGLCQMIDQKPPEATQR